MKRFVMVDRKPILPLPEDAYGFCVPCGIGDAVWLYAKLAGLSSLTGRQVYLSIPDAEPRRGHQLLEILPNVQFAGYETGWAHWDVMQQALPPTATLEDFTPGKWQALQVNSWLEAGNALADWLPWLGTEYHFKMSITAEERKIAAACVEPLPKPYVVAYVSNRDKAKYHDWALWRQAEWVEMLTQAFPERAIVLVGAEYDRDFTQDVAVALTNQGAHVRTCLGRPLGAVIELIRKASYCVSYPSGIGILAGVVRTPTLMLLPACHSKLHGFADPVDVASGRFKTLVNPTVAAAVEWVRGGR